MDEEPQMTKLLVERLHRFSSRPWIFLTGRLDGGVLHIGDRLSVTYRNLPAVDAVIRTIELHGPPGKTTIAVDADLADHLGEGAVLTRLPG